MSDLSVVGAGFGRTGTMSMKSALEHLGFGPCHHMMEVFGRPEDVVEWAAAIRGAPWDRERALDGFRSTLDFPACMVWEELWRANPGSKVLLTVRSADSWWRSFDATIGPAMRAHLTDGSSEQPLFAAIFDVVFDGRSDDRATAVAAFESHNRSVIEAVPADQLLVYELGSGWEPLCRFLDVEVPDLPFPSSNSTAEFLAGSGDPDDAGSPG